MDQSDPRSAGDPITVGEPGSLPLGWSVALWLTLAALTWVGVFYFITD